MTKYAILLVVLALLSGSAYADDEGALVCEPFECRVVCEPTACPPAEPRKPLKPKKKKKKRSKKVIVTPTPSTPPVAPKEPEKPKEPKRSVVVHAERQPGPLGIHGALGLGARDPGHSWWLGLRYLPRKFNLGLEVYTNFRYGRGVDLLYYLSRGKLATNVGLGLM
jgi:hypothetical protein